MKIIHIVPNLNTGGAERLVKDICKEIHKRKSHEIKLITFEKKYNNDVKFNFHRHIYSNYMPSISSKSVINIEKLQQFINNYKPDIIHSHLWVSEILLTKIDIKSAKRFTHFHDNIPQLFTKRIPKNKIELINSFEKKLFLKGRNYNFVCIDLVFFSL